jgi:hypothetical protein
MMNSAPFLGGIQEAGQSPAAGWRWITGEPFEFTDWAGAVVTGDGAIEAEPNDYRGIDERELRMLDRFPVAGFEARNRRWNDANSAFEPYNSALVIEYPIPEPHTTALFVAAVVNVSIVRRRPYPSRNR